MVLFSTKVPGSEPFLLLKLILVTTGTGLPLTLWWCKLKYKYLKYLTCVSSVSEEGIEITQSLWQKENKAASSDNPLVRLSSIYDWWRNSRTFLSTEWRSYIWYQQPSRLKSLPSIDWQCWCRWSCHSSPVIKARNYICSVQCEALNGSEAS